MEKSMGENKTALSGELISELIGEALFMRSRSYSPYSEFAVGAALLSADGKIYGGCNIENAAYPVTICAERAAMIKAVSEGVREFRAVAVAGGREKEPEGYSFPCGSCRQFMREFCDSETFVVIVARSKEDFRIFTLEELLPNSFGPESLV